MNQSMLWQLAITFTPLSVMMIGGANATLPEIHRQVLLRGWMDEREFARVFAVSQIAPGPNHLIVSLIGWRLDGLAGLAVATVAVTLPFTLLTFAVSRFLARRAQEQWVRNLKQAMVPVAVGLAVASGVITSRAADHELLTVAITGAAALFVVCRDRNPLWVLAGAAGIGVLASHTGLLS